MNNHLTRLDARLFSERVRTERAKMDIQQIDMANQLGVPRSSLSYYESGKAVPSLDKTYLLAEYLNVPIDYLVGRDEAYTKTISSVGDIARLILRLCEFNCVSLDYDENGRPVLAFNNENLAAFFKNQMELKETIASLEIDAAKYTRIKEENIRMCLIGLDNEKVFPAVTDNE